LVVVKQHVEKGGGARCGSMDLPPNSIVGDRASPFRRGQPGQVQFQV
jgi:hypothetical protein